MAKILSPILKARIGVAAINDGAAVTELEMNFRIGQGQGVELIRSEAITGGLRTTTITAAMSSIVLNMSLHRRVGALEDPTAIGNTLASEILHYRVLEWVGKGGVAADGSGSGFHDMAGETVVNYREITDKGTGLFLASNLTFRGECIAYAGAATWDVVEFALWYRYVELTARELSESFMARQ